jgi:glycerophosphoryl diester phosphodiesterase
MLKIGHRGAPREFPANTMRSFARAAELGCEMVECDVRCSADAVLVLAHDAAATDASGRRYEVAAHEVTALWALDLGAGEGVPTLTELVEWARGAGIAVMADMKVEGDNVEAAVAAALAALAPEAKIVPGAGEASRRRFREADPALHLSLSLDREAESWLRSGGFERFLAEPGTEAVTWEHPLLTSERIRALKEHGLRVYAWTVDDPAAMGRLRDDGVDGLISNRPDLLRAL